ncbi:MULTISPECIES: folylpolyglutamate synthase/dihydrofolate synthase family protein [unclassified Sporosarcina]|uniref:bifunctional folylpolyglutamate synthase/dihydrofolate synthase n=1 Tax=unclassified Sporosarcina TaxID=2647733 RepID=UPI00203CDAF1|nr:MULTISPECIES: Mur ligase family protein [unclassified Sporosarcina]GKV66542.1 tetrahydrofolate synthase [Sporosarcina sp. NCCP-2331]GLB56819.1 tetrahydrofolate synthase [Sporosarcina sp. NCCP-2378]
MIPKLDEYKKQFDIESDDAIKPGLDAVMGALSTVLKPEKDLHIIHVAGTNGKGSTIAVMEAVLQAHGYTTGVFSSPAMIDLHDQIRINGDSISPNELEYVFEEMNAADLSGVLTDFELLTVAAFLAFRNASPDYVLLETGMGGRFDSTNVVMPLVSVITSISLDHTGFLGDTERKIARHKAGIIKPGIPAVIGGLSEEAREVMEEEAELNRSLLYVYGKDFRMNADQFEGMQAFELPERRMKGPHQAVNCAVALEALLAAGIPLKQKAVAEAVKTAQLPFRFQEIREGVFIDGAHNPAAAKMLVRTIMEQFPGEKVDWVIGMLNTKDYEEVLKIFAQLANSFTFVDFPHPQAAKAEDLLAVCPLNESKIVSISEIDREQSGKHKKVIAGSLYLLSSLMRQ